MLKQAAGVVCLRFTGLQLNLIHFYTTFLVKIYIGKELQGGVWGISVTIWQGTYVTPLPIL
jgi:hypothetical protein